MSILKEMTHVVPITFYGVAGGGVKIEGHESHSVTAGVGFGRKASISVYKIVVK